MSKFKKLLSMICVASLAVSLSACADTSWIAKIDKEKVNAGVYLFYMNQGYQDAFTKLQKDDDKITEKKVFSKKLDDKTINEYIQDFATDKCRESIAINKKFDELKLELTEKDQKIVENKFEEDWKNNSDTYEKNGVGKKSIQNIILTNYKSDLLFKKYYYKDGLEEVSENDINKNITDNYKRVKILPFTITDKDGKELDDAGKEKVVDEAKKTIKDLEAKAKNIDTLIDDYYKSLSPNQDTEENTDEFRNEAVVYEGYYYLETPVVEEILKLKDANKYSFIKGTAQYYVVQNLDILKREDLKNDLKPTALFSLKGDEFSKKITEWHKDYSVVKNDDAYKRYLPEKYIKKVQKNAEKDNKKTK